MHSSDAKKVQTALINAGYLHGKADGIYGPETAGAVRKAKYWLGYALKNVEYRAGDAFYALVTGNKQPSLAMKARIAARKRQLAGKPLGDKIADEATKWISTKENPPGSNKVKFSEWYGVTGPWCAMFVTWCGVTAGSKSFSRSARYAYVPFMVNDAFATRNGLSRTPTPVRGDLVAYDWNHDGVADHVGIFDKWTTGKTQFSTIEGNTAVGNDSNGGEVMRRQRNITDVQCFIHVNV